MRIMEYAYRPVPRFFLLDGESEENTFTYGFELEVRRHPEWRHSMDSVETFVENDLTDMIEETFDGNLFYAKYDGSVSDGFELVSHPMSWGFFKENADKFEKLIRFLQDNHYVSEKGGRCGLHFHIGDRYIETVKGGSEGLLHFAANMQLIMNHYKTDLIAFSRRRYHQMRWCSFDSEGEEFQTMKNSMRHKLKNRSSNRYVALNTTNSNTLEIRLMRGTTNWKTFYLSFHLVHNLAEAALQDGSYVGLRDLIFGGLDCRWTRRAERYIENRDIDLMKEPVLTAVMN